MERLMARETDPSVRRFHNHQSRKRDCYALHPNTDPGLGLRLALAFWFAHDPQPSFWCLSGISPVFQIEKEIPRSSRHYGETIGCALIPDYPHASPCLSLQYSSQWSRQIRLCLDWICVSLTINKQHTHIQTHKSEKAWLLWHGMFAY